MRNTFTRMTGTMMKGILPGRAMNGLWVVLRVVAAPVLVVDLPANSKLPILVTPISLSTIYRNRWLKKNFVSFLPRKVRWNPANWCEINWLVSLEDSSSHVYHEKGINKLLGKSMCHGYDAALRVPSSLVEIIKLVAWISVSLFPPLLFHLRSEPWLWLCELCSTWGCAKSFSHSQWTPATSKDN